MSHSALSLPSLLLRSEAGFGGGAIIHIAGVPFCDGAGYARGGIAGFWRSVSLIHMRSPRHRALIRTGISVAAHAAGRLVRHKLELSFRSRSKGMFAPGGSYNNRLCTGGKSSDYKAFGSVAK